ncbi:MAG: alpha-galactosidase [Terracidiphilus sp.]|nr:alpha-galactosidase [Terracidiphilus sp.]
MASGVKTVVWVVATMLYAVNGRAQGLSASLENGPVALRVEAGANAPRVVELRRSDAAAWRNVVDDALPEAVEKDGKRQVLRWRLNRAESRAGKDAVELVYDAEEPRLRLWWTWHARGGAGPLEHEVRVRNLTGEELWLLAPLSLRVAWKTGAAERQERFWVEKGADTPSDTGTHLEAFPAGASWSCASSTYAHPAKGEQRECIPYVLVEQAEGRRAGWYLGIEFSGRTRIAVNRNGATIAAEAGLNDDRGPVRTRLTAGGEFTTPTVFLGAAEGGVDGAGNELRRWVRAALNNARTMADPKYPVLVNNSWGSGMAINETQARAMIGESQALGLEMFHVDAGWFRGVGDWQPNPEKFPNGVAAVADYAHAHGLRFGLWTDWTQAGTAAAPGALKIDDASTRDWLTVDPPAGWKHTEEFKGITIDIGLPAARQWAASEVERMVSDFHLDMLEHDGYLVAQGTSRTTHPAAAPDPATMRIYEDSGFLWVDGTNSTDVSYHATRAYYAIQDELHRRHPGLLLEACNDGGRMVDFGSAAHSDYFSITDTYDPLSNRRAFYDTSYVLPPAMLESYVEKWPVHTLGNLRYMLRSGMMGWFSLMLDSTAWNAEQHEAARAEIALYREKLRPLIREADLYHVTARPDGVHWDGIEYFDPRTRKGVVYAFRGSMTEESAHRFVLQGVDPKRHYRVIFNDSGRMLEDVSGSELLNEGVEVALPEPYSSELVFLVEKTR